MSVADHRIPVLHLSPMQLRVLQELVLGNSPKQIASDLGCTMQNVRLHILHGQDKLGAKTREQAVAIALYFGLIEFPPNTFVQQLTTSNTSAYALPDVVSTHPSKEIPQ